MDQDVNMHLTWADAFNDANRIEANFNEQHAPIPAHDHEFTEIVVVLRGSCRHYHAKGEQLIGKGDAFLMRPGAWHAYRQCRNLTLYNCCFDPGILGRELGWMIDEPLLGRLLWSIPLSPAQHGTVLLRLPESALRKCRKTLDELVGLSTPDKVNHPVRLGLLIQLLATVAQHLPVESKREPPKPNPSVIAALKLIDDHPEDAWSLESLAARVHVLPDYLTRSFNKVAALPPMAYLRRRRLEMATSLLTRSEYSMSEVGSLVGWPDANYFTRRFRAEFGLTPTAYRKRFSKVSQATAKGAFQTTSPG